MKSIIISGISNSRYVIRGSFKLYDTYGFSLADLLLAGYLPDWLNFYADALRHGWTFDQIFRYIVVAIKDSGSNVDANIIINRLKGHVLDL